MENRDQCTSTQSERGPLHDQSARKRPRSSPEPAEAEAEILERRLQISIQMTEKKLFADCEPRIERVGERLWHGTELRFEQHVQERLECQHRQKLSQKLQAIEEQIVASGLEPPVGYGEGLHLHTSGIVHTKVDETSRHPLGLTPQFAGMSSPLSYSHYAIHATYLLVSYLHLSMPELDPRLYTVAWIAPLEIEARAALYMLDHIHQGRFALRPGDDYVFLAGDACGHNIIITTLPAGQEYGTGSAAALASQVKRFFPNLWFSLLVGVAAGLPNLSCQPPRDIRLGDVLVALPQGESAGLVAYDLGKETGAGGFQPLRSGHVLATTETVVRSAIGSIKLRSINDADLFLEYYNAIRDRVHATGTFADPGQDQDKLYKINQHGLREEVERPRRPVANRTRVWYGPIGSGDKLNKDAQKRIELRDRYNLNGLEMEAAGTINRIAVGVIRGVCDYGDETKNKVWQPFGAAMAAAFAKAILAEILPHKNPSHNGNATAEDSISYRPVSNLVTSGGLRKPGYS